MADIIGFASNGVQVSLATGGGHFASPVLAIQNYAINAGGWTSQNQYPRLLGDVNGDGMADIVGFASDGVYVSLATGGGHFASPVFGIANFGYLAGAGSWISQDQYPRLLADVNGDGMADIVGFSADMTIVSLATGNGHFATPLAGIRNFTISTGGWTQNPYPRDLGDVNGDGRADIVGFAQAGVFEALSNGFAPTDITLSGGSAPEDSLGGTTIATAHGIDPFAGALTYSLTDNPGGRFLIHQDGKIAIVDRALMDYETGGLYHVTVRAADQYGVNVERDFTLHVTDVNEAPTDATWIGGTARTHAANGSYVGTVVGADPDAGSVLGYALLDDAGGRFALDASTGVVTVKDGTQLDYATAHSWSIGVRTSDQGGLFHDDTLTVTVAPKPTVSDFNADGKSDLLLLNDATHGLYVCEMNGAVMEENALSFTIAAGAGWHYQGLGDFDGDRKSDVLLLNYTSDGVYVCLMNGTQLGTNAQRSGSIRPTAGTSRPSATSMATARATCS